MTVGMVLRWGWALADWVSSSFVAWMKTCICASSAFTNVATPGGRCDSAYLYLVDSGF